MIESIEHLRECIATIAHELISRGRQVEAETIVDAAAAYMAEPFGAASIGATTTLAAVLNPYAGGSDRIASHARIVLNFISRSDRKPIGTAVVPGRGVVRVYDVHIVEATVVGVGKGKYDAFTVSIAYALIGADGTETHYGETVAEFNPKWLEASTIQRADQKNGRHNAAAEAWLDACRNEVILKELGKSLGEREAPPADWCATPPTVAGFYWMSKRSRDADGNLSDWNVELVELAPGTGDRLEINIFGYLGTDRVLRQDRELTRWLGPIEKPAPPAEVS